MVRWRHRNVRAAGIQSLQPVLRVFRLYGIGLLPSRPSDMVSLVISRNVFSNFVIDAALQSGQLAYTGNFSITAALYAAIAPGIRVGMGVGYTNNPTPVIFTPQTGSNLNLLANVITYW